VYVVVSFKLCNRVEFQDTGRRRRRVLQRVWHHMDIEHTGSSGGCGPEAIDSLISEWMGAQERVVIQLRDMRHTLRVSINQPLRNASSRACSASSSDNPPTGPSLPPDLSLTCEAAGPNVSPRATGCRLVSGDETASPVGASVS